MTTRAYARKAEKYARYRWDYAPGAIHAIFEIAGLTVQSCVADLGAGTGILTRPFVERVGQVYLVEPNLEMRQQAEPLAGPTCTLIAARAEQTNLPDQSVDLVTVAQAIHWFDPEPARREILRILKPGGWLALIRNYGTDSAMSEAMTPLMTAEYGVASVTSSPYPSQPPGFYFGQACFQKLIFPFVLRQDWETFIGSLCSAAYCPDEDDPRFPRLAAAARAVFERFSQNGWRDEPGETELIIGQPKF